MRTLHLLKTSVGATWALRQTRELVKLGVEVHVALPPGPLVPRYEAAGVMVHLRQYTLPLRQPYRWHALFADLRHLIERTEPDVIHSHFVGTTLTLRLALGKRHPVPRLFQVPGPLHLEHSIFRSAEIGTAGPVDSWIGSCQWTCDRYHQSGIPSERIFLSHYGSDLDELSLGVPGRLRKVIGVEGSSPIIGMVAYMYAPKRYLGQTRGLKGHEDLIDALAICRKTRPDLVGVFIGGAWNNATHYEQRVKKYATVKLGTSARFLGTRSDVSLLYPDIDVAVHPSHSENLGGAAESVLLGIPTIATSVGGFPDLIIPGETGWLVPPRSPEQLAEAILEAMSDRSHAMKLAKDGQVRARSMLDIRENARQVACIYEQVTRRSDALTNSRRTGSLSHV